VVIFGAECRDHIGFDIRSYLQ